ncbi:hypothetical protein [Bacillus mycoides]|uniref:Uncharacterized protein n=1 Tax=Bacillus mycoides (strain KBAB4) TaxID=315730 RepID=A9VT37_BACMK|nr:hypothetical protein [Bacillus mycoides]ABY44793.1 hypothetical protein BcerKBAB4_3622 [Bacillus mycoides KBAB4]
MSLTQIFDVLKLTFAVAVVSLILKTWVMIKASELERIFFSQEKNLMINLVRLIFIAIILTPLSIWYLSYGSNISINNVRNEEIIFLLIMSLLLSIFAAFQLVYPFFSDPLGKDAYYIVLPDQTKAYLIKSLNRNEILAYTHPRFEEINRDKNTPEKNQIIILKKDDVKTQRIFRIRYKKSFIESLKIKITDLKNKRNNQQTNN